MSNYRFIGFSGHDYDFRATRISNGLPIQRFYMINKGQVVSGTFINKAGDFGTLSLDDGWELEAVDMTLFKRIHSKVGSVFLKKSPKQPKELEKAKKRIEELSLALIATRNALFEIQNKAGNALTNSTLTNGK